MPRGKGHLDSEGRTLDPGSQSRTNPPSQLSSQFINRLRNNLPPRAVSPGSQSGRRPGLGLGGPGSGSIPLPFGDASKPPQKKHWGKSSSTALISLEHNLPITVSHDVIQVSGQPALLVGPDGLDGIILKDVFSAIAQEARSWGPPPENFFWTPHIQVAVTPGGEYTFTRLQSALEQAGMRVSDHLDFDARITPAVEQPDAPPSH